MSPVQTPAAERLAALQATVPDGAIALVGDLVDVRWVTGLKASNALLAVTSGSAWLITDFRYRTAAEEVLIDGLQLEIVPDLVGRAGELANEAAVTQVLLAKDRATLADDAKLASVLHDGIERVAGTRLVEPLRQVKTPAEIDAIAAAQALADEAFREVILEGGIVGKTEAQVALDLEFAMRRRGAEAISFDPIIAAGAHGALPHANPRDVAIPANELVVIDWGAQLDGYCSDCTRTVATGEIDDKRREVHEIVRRAQDVALEAIKPGASGKEVDALSRALIADAGYGDYFGHGLGHGVGLEVHETPTLSPRATGDLADGHIVTVEPGIYLPGEFGVRVEELVAVSADGPRILTSLPREASVVD